MRPDSVSVTLSGSDGKTYKATLTKDGGFSETFENLPVFFNNGTKIAYTVTEDAVAGYIGKTATDDRSVMAADLFAIYNYFLLLPIRTFSQFFHKNSDFIKRKSRPKAADSIMAHLLYTL